ncbi:hypothetical protein SDC9_172850 [bioreactor metagenome]|uniref:Uncharacterized protein n=1 Tax=bioreactor metagenome TaxID=1076179 RepID=A0A645GEV3_9ZZZZ
MESIFLDLSIFTNIVPDIISPQLIIISSSLFEGSLFILSHKLIKVSVAYGAPCLPIADTTTTKPKLSFDSL